MRLTRDRKWFFQYFPYHQMYMDNELVKGWVAINYLTDGETRYWNYEKSGDVAVCGKGMIWLTIIPDGSFRVSQINPQRGERTVRQRFLKKKQCRQRNCRISLTI